jgi:hypothetical protein
MALEIENQVREAKDLPTQEVLLKDEQATQEASV